MQKTDLTKPCPDCRRVLTNEPKCYYCAERDALRAELTAAKNLLARIHRDGGHHTEAVGFLRSAADAGDKVSEWLLAAEERTALAAHDAALLREVAKQMDPDGGCYEALMAEADRIAKEASNGSALLRDAKQALSDAIKQANEILDRQGIPRSNAARSER